MFHLIDGTLLISFNGQAILKELSNVFKELPKVFNKWITDISRNQNFFDAAKTRFEQALRNSSFNEELRNKKKKWGTNSEWRKQEEKKEDCMV